MTITVSRTFETEAEAAAWLAGKGGSSTSNSSSSSGKGETKPSGPKNTREQLAAVMDKVKNKGSADIARAIIAEGVGKACKLAEVPEDKIDVVFKLGTEKIAEIEKAAAEEV